MKKFVGIFDVESFHKVGTDQGFIYGDKEERVTTVLKPNGYVGGGEIVDKISVHTKDKQSPDWSEVYVVTVEQIELPVNEGSNIRDFLEQTLREKREGTPKPVTIGRKFR